MAGSAVGVEPVITDANNQTILHGILNTVVIPHSRVQIGKRGQRAGILSGARRLSVVLLNAAEGITADRVFDFGFLCIVQRSVCINRFSRMDFSCSGVAAANLGCIPTALSSTTVEILR